ncbi:PREDICTED: sepiapterin reductase-like [Amphimedon queenslandica]|uniref:Sepiapterin reductase n=1 Tax=Amphimedon queenslandica TaxID=400682 RepID=A0A1X7SES2_AMPQE|nr:PREDICTED: sepiapterin reductase-like [Amphimedon queenslandica]|eukprot:XP_003392127.2 PREDICTED: sepiapterin reductase-like [Amphimedon queenslandica]
MINLFGVCLPFNINIMAAFFKRSTYCIVTGASGGLGRELAIQLSREWSATGSTIVLVSRNVSKLQETKEMIAKSSPVNVTIVPADLGDLACLSDISTKILDGYSSEKYNQAAIFHNAGSLGDIVTPTADQTDPAAIAQYLTANYTSMWILTTRFLSCIKTGPRFIMNMSSLAAKIPFGGGVAYASIKAARNVFLKALAIEHPDVRMLSYSPGPCDTDMLHAVRNEAGFASTKASFQDLVRNNQVLSVAESISKLMELIKEDKFKNAAIIDYFD